MEDQQSAVEQLRAASLSRWRDFRRRLAPPRRSSPGSLALWAAAVVLIIGSVVVGVVSQVVSLLRNWDWLLTHMPQLGAAGGVAVGAVENAGLWFWNWPGSPVVCVVIGLAVLFALPPRPSISPSEGAPSAPASPYPDYFIHAHVLWADHGTNKLYVGGGPTAIGPMCPQDFAYLRYMHPVEAMVGGQSEDLEDEHAISATEGVMSCPICGKQITFGAVGKTVGGVRGEADSICAARRRQRARGITPRPFTQTAGADGDGPAAISGAAHNAPRVPLPPSGRRWHDYFGVKWEDTGTNSGPVIDGPFCPTDYARLWYWEKGADPERRPVGPTHRVVRAKSALECPKCGKRPAFKPKVPNQTVEEARIQVQQIAAADVRAAQAPAYAARTVAN
jgi:hypothetical protein